jgi:hypothetical protein
MRLRWKVWLAGIALAQLLVVGVEVALWPTPSEAERLATRVRLGMTKDEARRALDGYDPYELRGWDSGFWCHFADQSDLNVGLRRDAGPKGVRDTVSFIHTGTAPPEPPLTRLRRTLARVFPFLAE